MVLSDFHPPRWLRPLLGITTLCVMAIWLRHDLADVRLPGLSALPMVAVLMSLWVANQLMLAQMLRQALGDSPRHPHGWPHKPLLAGSVLRSYFNLLLPLSGTALLAAHLRTRIDLPMKRYWQATLRLLIYQSAMLGMLLIALLSTHAARGRLELAIAAAAILALTPLILPAAARLRHLPGWIARLLEHLGFGDQTDVARIGVREIAVGIALQFISFGLRLIRLYVALRIMGSPAPLVPLFFMQVSSDLATLLNLTPNSLGIREGAIVFAGHIGGLPGGLLLAAALLDRVFTTGILVLWGQWLIWRDSARH